MTVAVKDRPLHVPNLVFLAGTPLVTFIASSFYIYNYGVTVFEVALFAIFYFLSGISITGGYHRLFAHLSYRAHWTVRLFFLVFGAASLQNSALEWCSLHRLHHRYTDTAEDPYNAGEGFWWSHIGWIIYAQRDPRQGTNVADLKQDPLFRWQHKHYMTIAFTAGFIAPAVLGWFVGRPFGCFLWGGLIKVVLLHHATFFINSLAHLIGTQPFSRKDSSRDSAWLATITYGEGYHNFHHKFPADYRNGIRWFNIDVTKWIIYGLSAVGLVTSLNRTAEEKIQKAREEIAMLEKQEQASKS
eukprot:TRINITY_DN5389_c0_g1_i1.p1 TRINITY_DN5389_c0_g1~~TRINITY_DN5389_c0_g1_i1.p1  ORF type:complete len:318 (-),score=49.16 TRINITY_DN5389_c0_g1_i1:180-1079(-)